MKQHEPLGQTQGDRVRYWRLKRGLSQTVLAKRAGIKQATIANLESGRNKQTRFIVQIATALGIDSHELSTGKRSRPKALAKEAVEGNLETGPAIEGTVPILSWNEAGHWKILTNKAGRELAETTAPIGKYTYALRVRGDSMEPMFPDGSLIIVEPELLAEPEDYVVVCPEAGATALLRQLIQDAGGLALKPVNPRYAIVPLKKDAAICGVVREVVKRFR